MDRRYAKVGQVVDRLGFDEWKNLEPMAPALWRSCIATSRTTFVGSRRFVVDHAREAWIAIVRALWQELVSGLVVHERKSDLTNIARTGHSPSGLSRGLDCWQQQTDEDSDDGDDHQKLNERKTFGLGLWSEARPISETFDHRNRLLQKNKIRALARNHYDCGVCINVRYGVHASIGLFIRASQNLHHS